MPPMRSASLYITVVTTSAESLFGDPLVGDNKSSSGVETRSEQSKRAFWSQLVLLVGYGAMFLLCILLISYMRIKRHDAFRGDEKAARKIILPAFEPLLWILAAATGTYVAFFCTTLATNYYHEYPPKRDLEIFYSGRQFVFVIVLVFMLQKSVSLPALRRAVVISIFLATYTIPIVWMLTAYYDPTGPVVYWGQTVSRSLLQIFFVYVFFWPPGRAQRKPLRQFCVFVFVYFGITMLSLLFTRFKLKVYSAVCGYIAMGWATLCPLLIWRVLKADTEFWRGLGQRACSFQRMGNQQVHIDERISSRGLHLLIEMHRKFVIDFAHLELKKKIGVGANAVVFNGVLNSTIPIAAKVYTPQNFTEETVAAFSHEAALCATLHHPNIVKFHGMCICPPTVCLVSELCQGNLEDVIIAISSREQSPNRQQALINIGYMIDAARALAYIHSFSPPFLHRDVKPANFLVDVENNVKLTDFGESRSLPRQRLTELQEQQSRDNSTHAVVLPMVKMTVTGTVDYMAPEMISGRAGLATYGEAADVYSLAITFWDILNPGQDRYPRQQCNPMLIFETVVDGTRPDLDIPMHSRLRELVANSWQTDPSLRPSARTIVTQLEAIQEELLATFASDLCNDFDQSGLPHRSPSPCHEKYFTGEYAIEKMQDFAYAGTSCEGIRLGCALMDAGFLHHLSHSQGFEDNDSMYFFDEENVKFCQPFAILEADLTEDSGGSCSSGELQAMDSFTSSTRKIGGTKGILSQLTASLTSSGRSQSKSSFLSNSDRTDSSSETSDRCQCPRFGRRMEPLGRQSQRHHHRRRHQREQQQQQRAQQVLRRKCPPIIEEDNTLEHKLLEDDDGSESVGGTPSPHERRSSQRVAVTNAA
ncbi:Tkl protein kinase [Globisporangium polare]